MVELSQRSQQMQTAKHLVEEMRQRLLNKTRGEKKKRKRQELMRDVQLHTVCEEREKKQLAIHSFISLSRASELS